MLKAMTFELYQELPAYNASFLADVLNHSPMHARYYRDNPQPATEAMKFGHLYHAMVLEPDAVAGRYMVAPEVDKRTKRGKEEWADAVDAAAASGMQLVSASDYSTAQAMAAAVHEHMGAGLLLAGKGVAEGVMEWVDPQTGLPCKARLDWWREVGLILDLKTTSDGSPEAFLRSVHKYHYDMRAAFYSAGQIEVFGNPVPFVWLAQEKTPPYAVAAYRATPDMLAVGEVKYSRAMDIVRRCHESGIWPGYGEGEITNLDPAPWAYKNEVGEYNG